MENTSKRKVTAADILGGDVLVHFLTGEPVVFRADFLWQGRNEDGNQTIPAPDQTSDELFFLEQS